MTLLGMPRWIAISERDANRERPKGAHIKSGSAASLAFSNVLGEAVPP